MHSVGSQDSLLEHGWHCLLQLFAKRLISQHGRHGVQQPWQRRVCLTPAQRLIMSLSASWRQDAHKWVCPNPKRDSSCLREGFCATPVADSESCACPHLGTKTQMLGGRRQSNHQHHSRLPK